MCVYVHGVHCVCCSRSYVGSQWVRTLRPPAASLDISGKRLVCITYAISQLKNSHLGVGVLVRIVCMLFTACSWFQTDGRPKFNFQGHESKDADYVSGGSQNFIDVQSAFLVSICWSFPFFFAVVKRGQLSVENFCVYIYLVLFTRSRMWNVFMLLSCVFFMPYQTYLFTSETLNMRCERTNSVFCSEIRFMWHVYIVCRSDLYELQSLILSNRLCRLWR